MSNYVTPPLQRSTDTSRISSQSSSHHPISKIVRMSPKIDLAILKALSLDAASTTLASHGGSGFSSTYKLSSRGSDGEEKLYFVKTGGKKSETMFAGKS